MMKKKTVASSPQVQWDPANKETWHYDFENEPVNDEKWACIVAAMVPAKLEDEECIEVFAQCMATETRKTIKIIRMTDIINALQESEREENKDDRKIKVGSEKKNITTDKSEDGKRKTCMGRSSKNSRVIRLAAKYASYGAIECKLPPDLMAAVLKSLILNLKEESVFRKRKEASRERKMRERAVEIDFIKSMTPFKANREESRIKGKNSNAETETVNDEPCHGPDLFVVLTDFYDPLYFPELSRINVPFLALVKISHFKEITSSKFSHTALPGNGNAHGKKEALIFDFWKALTDKCKTLEETMAYKDFLFMQYQPQFSKSVDFKQFAREVIFEELSSMMYSIYVICRQHRTYLQETYVQRMIASLEPLDLSKCEVYNRLSDAPVSGGPSTVVLILYAMIEQVAEGVPFTKSVHLDYKHCSNQYFANYSDLDDALGSEDGTADSETREEMLVPPCAACRGKTPLPSTACQHYSSGPEILKRKREEESKPVEKSVSPEKGEEALTSVGRFNTPDAHFNDNICDAESISNPSWRENKTESEGREKANWTGPVSCFYGDQLANNSRHRDSTFTDSESLVRRFLMNTDIPELWSKYPELAPEKKAFYNFHFLRLLRVTKLSPYSLKIHIFFALCMKLIGIAKSYLYKGEEENLSELFRTPSREKPKKLSRVRFDPDGETRMGGREDKNFSSCFFRQFNSNAGGRKKVTMKADGADKQEKSRGSFLRTDSAVLKKVTSFFNVSLVTHRNSGYCFSYFFKTPDSANFTIPINIPQDDKELAVLHSLLDCYEISSLSESYMLNSEEDYVDLIKNFNFFEELVPQQMVQRLLEAQEDFNTIQCTYFPPTDTLIVILHNDSDHRGVFFTSGYGTLPTPVSLRDFYGHVYIELGEWLAEEKEEYKKFVAGENEKAKETELKKQNCYRLRLKKKLMALSEAERKDFLNALSHDGPDFASQSECEATEDELEELPRKTRLQPPRKASFLATNFIDVRVETERKVHEFHSRDGTEIDVLIDSWLYDSSRLLTLSIKRSKLKFWYHQWLGERKNTVFTLKTDSDIIMAFSKESFDSEASSKYFLKTSWPTGLILENVFDERFGVYVKQYYIDVYKKWWNLESEKFRCFLRNGQVLVFNEDESVEVLCASGTRHVLKSIIRGSEQRNSGGCEFSYGYQARTTCPTGEISISQQVNGNRGRSEKKLLQTLKVFIGVDAETGETFYRRDDGVSCMLWPSGKLVVNFPDGTKITSVPDFDSEETEVEWSEEEKLNFKLLRFAESEEPEESAPKSKTILKRPSPDSLLADSDSSCKNKRIFSESDGFLSVSASYLFENPKFSSVYYDSQTCAAEVKMPDGLSVKIHPDGSYVANQNDNYFSVGNDIVDFYTACTDCGERSSATLYLDSGDILCKVVDLFQTGFYVHTNGDTVYQEHAEQDSNVRSETVKKCTNASGQVTHNASNHVRSISENQRCFALNRNLSGIEFLHGESLAQYCHDIPSDTHYNLHCKNLSDSFLTHVFSSPYYASGLENWKVDLEDANDSLPTNLRRKDLKELSGKNGFPNLFKNQFPRRKKASEGEDCPRKGIAAFAGIPRIVVTRTVKCMAENPKSVMDDLKGHVARYQKKARDLLDEYKKHKSVEKDRDSSAAQIKIKLEKLAPPSNQRRSIQVRPSTELDVHKSAHRQTFAEELKSADCDFLKNFNGCKYVLDCFGKSSECLPASEESDSLRK